MTTEVTIIGQGGGEWETTLPDGVTLTQTGVAAGGPFFLDNTAGRAPLNINVRYDLDALFAPDLFHGIISLDFTDVDGPGQSNDVSNGLRGQVNLNLINDLDLSLGRAGGDTLFVFLSNNQSDQLNDPSGHPVYAHFHGVGTSYGALTTEARSLTSLSPGTPGAPSSIEIGGVFAAHSTATIGPIVLHERDQDGIDDSFLMNFFPTTDFFGGNFDALKAQWEAGQTPTTGGTGEVNWDALGARVEAYHNATDQWGILDDWLSPPPPAPDGGNMDYIL